MKTRTALLSLAGAVALALLGGLSALAVASHRQAEAQPRVFLIGNSLTWDAIPQRLDGAEAGRVQWHVYCGKNLRFIRDNPAGHCVDSSTPWPGALADGAYDFLSIQPHLGTTLAEDTAIVVEFAAKQPHAVLVLHTAWMDLEPFPAAFAANRTDGPMQPSPAYFDALLAGVREALPDREIRTTNCHTLLYAIHRDAAAGRGPFRSLAELGRDPIHMNVGPGRYLVHNAMRRALGQPPTVAGFEVTPEAKAYLDAKLVAHGWTPPVTLRPATDGDAATPGE